ncbi:hypothetical protein [Erysipelothrix anatis]|uniref:hypothetical protein n=1 Tax=Erysipelothrix anatis TaxID=2683713 RepID=UPI00135A11B0|nr:hypothetical protein [Erysipelothrix anatis]
MYLLIDVTTGSVVASGSIPQIEKQTKIKRERLSWSYNMNTKIMNGQYKLIKNEGDKL